LVAVLRGGCSPLPPINAEAHAMLKTCPQQHCCARAFSFGARLRARRQFPPAIHLHTRSFFLTLALRGCQQDESKGRGAMRTRIHLI
jgi:hypothetical protein